MAVNMAILINDRLIIFTHMDVNHSTMLGQSFLSNPAYLVVQGWIRPTVLFPSFIGLTGTNIWKCVRFSWVVRYWPTDIPYHCIVAVIHLAHPFAFTAYPL